MKHRMMINYDERFDVLYVGIKDRSNSYGDESQNDILYLRDFRSDEITGFTIFNFLMKVKNNTLPVLPKELDISFSKDIIPKITN